MNKTHVAARVLGPGVPMLEDRRLRALRHTRQTYTMPTYPTREAWLERAATLRRRILVTAGLWPEPERTPLQAQVWGRIERDGYSVEKVALQSFPGFYVAGNLYRPLGTPPHSGYPGVLNPHGHWAKGRLVHDERGSVPARCITFARQGFVAFSLDMVGYLDSRQVSHRTFGGWSALGEWLWSIHPLGLQLWNNIRALDFLTELPDVDPARLACTGASGGGTQTFLLTAVDPRVQVAAPVNMISAHYQGGCVCENAPGLRLDTFNVEIAALAAPRPLLLVSASGDWTVNTPSVEFPAVQRIYGLFGAEDRVESVQIDAGHNYNQASRAAVYSFFAHWLAGAPPGTRVAEQPLRVEPAANLRVFPADAPLPDGALDAAGVTAALIGRARDQIESAWPRDGQQAAQFRDQFGAAFHDVLAVEEPDSADLRIERRDRDEQAGYRLEPAWGGLIGRDSVGEKLPAVFVTPANVPGDSEPALRPVLLVHAQGKDAFCMGEGPGPLMAALLAEGRSVLTFDAFLTGEYAAPIGSGGRPVLEPHFTTFNRTDTQWRVHDVVTAVAVLRVLTDAAAVDLVGVGDAGLWCLLARAIAGPRITRLAADMNGFGWDDDAAYLARLYIPGLRRVGDLRTAVALAAPAPLLLHGTRDGVPEATIRDLYTNLGQPDALTISRRPLSPAKVIDWLSAPA